MLSTLIFALTAEHAQIHARSEHPLRADRNRFNRIKELPYKTAALLFCSVYPLRPSGSVFFDKGVMDGLGGLFGVLFIYKDRDPYLGS